MKKVKLITAVVIISVGFATAASATSSSEYIKQGALNEVGRIATHTAFAAVGSVFNGFGFAPYRGYGYGRYGYVYGSPYENAYQQEMENLRRQEYYRQLRIEQERGRNNAYRDFYGY